MGKKGGAQNSNVKGKNGPSSAQSKNQVGERQSAKEQKKKGNKKEAEKNDHSDVTLLRHPLVTLKVLVILIGRFLKATMNFVLSNLALIIGVLSLIAAF